MNRIEEIREAALKAALSLLDPAPALTLQEEAERAAQALTEAILTVILAVGKSVAVTGESQMADVVGENDAHHYATYLTGEAMQDGARWWQEELWNDR